MQDRLLARGLPPKTMFLLFITKVQHMQRQILLEIKTRMKSSSENIDSKKRHLSMHALNDLQPNATY